jgi:VWFA-related protein
MFRWGIAALAAAAVVCAGTGLGAGPQSAQDPPRQPFRTRITMVPLDVRVVDANGRPITDLKAEDFTILEDGVLQQVRHFSTSTLTPRPALAGTVRLQRVADGGALPVQERRVFLLMLARGRMQGPSRELPALLGFVKERLLPQDMVAVLAYNRATTFTTDHGGIARVLDEFRRRHEKIESLLGQHSSGLAAAYGSPEIPPHIQKEVDAIFEAAPDLRGRPVQTALSPGSRRRAEDDRRTADNLMRAELLAARPEGMEGLPDLQATAAAERLGLSFDEFVGREKELAQDMENLHAGIAYLRHIDGEKHLVLVTPKGISYERAEDNRPLARLAADARVTLNVIYTGGPPAGPPPRFISGSDGRPGSIVMSPLPTSQAVFATSMMAADHRAIARTTGGQASAFRYADVALRQIDEVTRFQYVLGYSPTNPLWDGRFRNIAVRVARKGATVLVRRGYLARDEPPPLDRRLLLAANRIAAAARQAGVLPDVDIRLDPLAATKDGESWHVPVQGTFRISGLIADDESGKHLAEVDIVILCADDRGRLIGEVTRSIEMQLTPASLQSFVRDGGHFDTTLTVPGRPAHVKVIVYEYLTDRVGSATGKVK